MKRLILAMLFAAGAAIAAPAPETFSDPALELRARHLQRELRCLVCRGESIDESNAELAGELRRLVREQIAAGRSDDAIKDYLHARYGDYILMQPPLEPATWLLWLAPFAVLAGAGAVAWKVVAAARKAAESEDSTKIADL